MKIKLNVFCFRPLDKLSSFDVEAGAFATTLKAMLGGQNAGMLQIKAEELPVRILVPQTYFDSVDKVRFLATAKEYVPHAA